MIEALSQFSTAPILHLHISGSNQIDSVWITLRIVPKAVSILLHYFSIGDHYCFFVDFLLEYFLGKELLPISRLEMRRLGLLQPKAVQNYLLKAKSLLSYYRIEDKILEVKSKWNESNYEIKA